MPTYKLLTYKMSYFCRKPCFPSMYCKAMSISNQREIIENQHINPTLTENRKPWKTTTGLNETVVALPLWRERRALT